MIDQKRGQLALAGGCFINLMTGSLYLWGTISTYVVSYFRKQQNPSLTMSLANVVFPFQILLMACFTNIGLVIAQKIGTRKTIFIFGLLNSLTIYLSSLTTQFWTFFIFFSIFQGIFSGCLYLIPIKIGVRYYPNSKGMVSGILLGTFGCSCIILSFCAVLIINPSNSKPQIHPDYYEYDESVIRNVPKALQYISFYFLFLTIFGSILSKNKKYITQIVLPERKDSQIYNQSIANLDEDFKQSIIENTKSPLHKSLRSPLHKSLKSPLQKSNFSNINQNLLNNSVHKEKEEKELPDGQLHDLQNIFEALGTKEIYILLVMIICSSMYGFFIASSFKDYGFQRIPDDKYLSLVIGNAASLSNGLGRLLFGWLLDIYGFRNLYFFVLLLQLALIFTIDMISSSKFFYCLWIILSMGCEGAHFVVFPAKTIQIYGIQLGTNIYSIVFFAFPIANLSQTFMMKELKTVLEYPQIFMIFLAITAISLILNMIFSFKKNFRKQPEQLMMADLQQKNTL